MIKETFVPIVIASSASASAATKASRVRVPRIVCMLGHASSGSRSAGVSLVGPRGDHRGRRVADSTQSCHSIVCAKNDPVKWMTDISNNHRYEAHFYFCVDGWPGEQELLSRLPCRAS